jgi:CubicO group peptidase (beta-lactamase class C family)
MSITKEIKQIFEKYAEDKYFSGTGLIKRGDSTLFSGAYGYAHKGWKIDNTVSTKFDTASITKLFTAVSILQLIDRELLSFEDKILDVLNLKDTSISKDVNIYHLLTHTSGIGDDADEEAGEDYEEIWKNKPNYSVRETVDFLPQFIHKKPNFEPGKGCRYNNCAFVLLGLVIEKLTGQKYREYVKENIFDRIDMVNTGFHSMDDINDNTAEGYAKIFDDNENVIGWRKNIFSFPPIGSPDGGAYTTVNDLDLFIRELKNNKLLSRKMTEELFKPKEEYRKHKNYTEKMGYGFEFAVKNDNDQILYMKKDGCNAGVACIYKYYPKIDTSLVILANQDCNVWALAWEIQELLIEEIS